MKNRQLPISHWLRKLLTVHLFGIQHSQSVGIYSQLIFQVVIHTLIVSVNGLESSFQIFFPYCGERGKSGMSSYDCIIFPFSLPCRHPMLPVVRLRQFRYGLFPLSSEIKEEYSVLPKQSGRIPDKYPEHFG